MKKFLVIVVAVLAIMSFAMYFYVSADREAASANESIVLKDVGLPKDIELNAIHYEEKVCINTNNHNSIGYWLLDGRLVRESQPGIGMDCLTLSLNDFENNGYYFLKIRYGFSDVSETSTIHVVHYKAANGN